MKSRLMVCAAMAASIVLFSETARAADLVRIGVLNTIGDIAVLIADEPTGNLDSATSAQIMEILLGLATEHGVTLIVVTHDQSLAARGDRTLVIKDGKISG